ALLCGAARAGGKSFARPTQRRLKPGVFNEIVELPAAINQYLAVSGETLKPLTWTADPVRSSRRWGGGNRR
ncbi:MAG: hypothetical protein ACREFH_12805, partial [Stellaceae bacterium]